MQYDYRKLRGKIREIYSTEKRFSQTIHISKGSLSKKLNNQTEWKQNEITSAIMLMKLSLSDIPKYFFTVKNDENN